MPNVDDGSRVTEYPRCGTCAWFKPIEALSPGEMGRCLHPGGCGFVHPRTWAPWCYEPKKEAEGD